MSKSSIDFTNLTLDSNFTSQINDSYFNNTNGTSVVPDLFTDDVRQLFKVVGCIQSFICIVGIVFNILNIFVLVKLVTRRRGVSPTYHLLIAMGVADIMVLFFTSLYLISAYVARDKVLLFYDLTDEHSDYYHVLHYIWMFPTNLFSISSNWLVVATTFFRFLAVAFPMKVCQW